MKQLISIVLSCLLLLSSSGLTYAQHFCGEYEMMSEIALGEKHLSCGMAMQTPGCDDETKDHDCCTNEYTQVETDDTFAKVSFNFQINTSFLIAFTEVFVHNAFAIPTVKTTFYKDYHPPPLGEDIQVLHQTFLI